MSRFILSCVMNNFDYSLTERDTCKKKINVGLSIVDNLYNIVSGVSFWIVFLFRSISHVSCSGPRVVILRF